MSGRTGLRYGELSELVWRDITLNGENSHVLVRASISKNKKEARIPLIPELEELLASFRPQDAKPTDRVFKEGVAQCATLRKDLEVASIPYIDESGRYAYFHALRYTFNTWLQTNGVPPRIAQELMMHGDRRLTDQVYLDSSLLPLQESMRSIYGYQKWTHIWTHISGKTGHVASRVGETGESGEVAGTPLILGSRRSLTQSDEDCEWRDRRDSNPKSNDAQSNSEKGIPPFTKEQWTQIWTHFPGEDRQKLTRVVQRWGSLSDELKRAVLRVVG